MRWVATQSSQINAFLVSQTQQYFAGFWWQTKQSRPWGKRGASAAIYYEPRHFVLEGLAVCKALLDKDKVRGQEARAFYISKMA